MCVGSLAAAETPETSHLTTLSLKRLPLWFSLWLMLACNANVIDVGRWVGRFKRYTVMVNCRLSILFHSE